MNAPVDWAFAQKELITNEGVFGEAFEKFEKQKNLEMEEKIKELEQKYQYFLV